MALCLIDCCNIDISRTGHVTTDFAFHQTTVSTILPVVVMSLLGAVTA